MQHNTCNLKPSEKNDRFRVIPAHPLYPQVLAAMKDGEAKSKRRNRA